jgi:formylglycine-generating enzyme required for sulfatase activity
MGGNVWEWTESLYCDYGTQDCKDFRHVLRGGGWDTPEPSDVRAAKRLAAEPTYRARGIGFRCAKTP